MSGTVESRRTPLYQAHIDAGGRMMVFGGWELPGRYDGDITAEHHAVRERVGLFDVSHMGRVVIFGEDDKKFLNYITTNNVMNLEVGQAQYTLMCRENGGVIDDLLVYQEGDFMMAVINAGNRKKDLAWMEEQSQNFNVTIEDVSDDSVLLALQGPKAVNVLSKLTEDPIDKLRKFRFETAVLSDMSVIISRTGYTGEDGFELWFDIDHATRMWNKLLEAGKDEGILPCGLGARNTLRMEAGMCLYGHELTEDVTPVMAGLDRHYVKFDKGDFIGREAMIERGREKLLTGFTALPTEPIPRDGHTVLFEGEEVGKVASGSPSPTLNLRIGTAFLPEELATPGIPIQIRVRDNLVNATTHKLPFYDRNKKVARLFN